MARWPDTEQELCEVVIDWLSSEGWDVYQEVEPYRSCGVADIVATRRATHATLVWVVECKKTMCLTLLEQCFRWRGFAHYVSAAIPGSRRCPSLARKILRDEGLGLLRVESSGHVYSSSDAPFRRAKADIFLDCICDEHASFAKAGNADGRRWTEFKRTCRCIQEKVFEKPGIGAKELISHIDHHYASDSSARSSIIHWARAGKIPMVELRQEGRRLRFYPKPEGP